jgi:organic hydroperoxide reductase OsmC/OhrA
VSLHHAQIHWIRGQDVFLGGRYSRQHELKFAQTITVIGTASPAVVPAQYCVSDAVDPEAAFVAALAGCHMLWFLSIAASAGFIVDDYLDAAQGTLGSDAGGALAMTDILLRPTVRFAPHAAPEPSAYETLHEKAHTECFLARSVRCPIRIQAIRLIT